jgi:putative acetyltransferase
VVTAHVTHPRGPAVVRDALLPGELDGVRTLFREYAQALDALGDTVCAAGFEREIQSLPGEYAAPTGHVLVADGAPPEDGASPPELAGVVALRGLTRATSEMKRLFVRPAFRAKGVGRELALAAIAKAKAIGYERLVLDTLPTMTEAIALYRHLGFHRIARYNDNHAPGVLFLERRLV